MDRDELRAVQEPLKQRYPKRRWIVLLRSGLRRVAQRRQLQARDCHELQIGNHVSTLSRQCCAGTRSPLLESGGRPNGSAHITISPPPAR